MILQVNVLRVSLLDLHIFPVLVAPTYESAMLLGISLSSPTHYYVRHLFHQFKCWSFWVVTNWGISSKQKSAPFQSVNIQKSKKSNFIWEKHHQWSVAPNAERERERERESRTGAQTDWEDGWCKFLMVLHHHHQHQQYWRDDVNVKDVVQTVGIHDCVRPFCVLRFLCVVKAVFTLVRFTL